MTEPVYMTGRGIVCAIGLCKEETADSLTALRTGIGPVRHLRTVHAEFPVGEVKLSNEEMCRKLGIPESAPSSRTQLMGTLALKEALAEAGLLGTDLKISFINGTTVGGMDKSEQYYLDFLNNDSRNDFIKTHDCGICTQMIGDYFGCFSFMTCISTACSSAANAMIMAANLIRSGQTDIAVAGGTECITKFHLNGFNALKILDLQQCRPFDASRAGLNLGEGAGYVVMESLSSLKKRGVKPLAILEGYGNACDAYHQTTSSPDGEGAYLCMSEALTMAGLKPEDIDYINAHGTGTPNNDESETTALKRVFGDSVPPFSSTKSFTGHTTSASGSIEAIICSLAIDRQFIPLNLGWKQPMENGLIPAHDDMKPAGELRHVLCNSFGFGGNDSSLIIGQCKGLSHE